MLLLHTSSGCIAFCYSGRAHPYLTQHGAGPPLIDRGTTCRNHIAGFGEGPPPLKKKKGSQLYPLLLNSASHGKTFINDDSHER